MATGKVMDWVERLPEVGDPILKQREAIQAQMDESAVLEKQAETIRGQAYFAALRLTARCRELWTDAQIEQAKQARRT